MRDLIYVEWRDAHGGLTEWNAMSTMMKFRERKCIVSSIGWVVSYDDKNLIICPHIVTEDGLEDSGCGDMTIPTGVIVKITQIPISSKDGTPKGTTWDKESLDHSPVITPQE